MMDSVDPLNPVGSYLIQRQRWIVRFGKFSPHMVDLINPLNLPK